MASRVDGSATLALHRTQFKPDDQGCESEDPIRTDEWWRLAWLPFCGDGGGNLLCVDMEPGEAGVEGQVITMWHDDPTRVVLAASLTAFVEMIARDFDKRQHHVGAHSRRGGRG